MTDDQKVCDHEWEWKNDSFDHEFGTEQIFYWVCQKCELTKPSESQDCGDDGLDQDFER